MLTQNLGVFYVNEPLDSGSCDVGGSPVPELVVRLDLERLALDVLRLLLLDLGDRLVPERVERAFLDFYLHVEPPGLEPGSAACKATVLSV